MRTVLVVANNAIIARLNLASEPRALPAISANGANDSPNSCQGRTLTAAIETSM